LEWFVRNLPERWEGRLFFADGAFSAMHSGRGDAEFRRDYRGRLKALTENMFDRRVRWLDGIGISKEMRMYAEQGPERITGSQHFHRHCREEYGNEGKIMTICSNVTEFLAHLLLGHTLGPKDRLSKKAAGERGVATYCHACPREMLPFRITPYPDMKCSSGALHARTDDEVAVTGLQKCPQECMSYEVVRNITTQSGIVHERLCPGEFFASTRAVAVEAEYANDRINTFFTISLAVILLVIFMRMRKQKRQLLNFVLSKVGAKEKQEYSKLSQT
jgi:hypothetical protein